MCYVDAMKWAEIQDVGKVVTFGVPRLLALHDLKHLTVGTRVRVAVKPSTLPPEGRSNQLEVGDILLPYLSSVGILNLTDKKRATTWNLSHYDWRFEVV